MRYRELILGWLATLAASAAFGGAAPAAPPENLSAALQAIDSADMMQHIKVMASDDFEGRSPGTRGETLTVEYLVRQFKKLGLKPGNQDSSYTQTVPVVAYKSEPRATFRIGERTIELKSPSEVVAWSYQRTPEVRVDGSELVFVGYGVIAPEYGWDDYKGQEVRGKTLVLLINDPPVPDPADPSRLDDKMFGGRAMTYYGRYTYKCEMAARLGAAAVIIVHETGPAAYPWSVVVSTWAGENFSLDTSGPNPDFPTVSAWITLDSARDLFAASGRSFEAMKQAAVSKDFKPVSLGGAVTFHVRNTWRAAQSRNVLARIEGSDPKLRHDHVIYSAHWDHFGWDPKLPGTKHEQIKHGALDNASGVAALLALARGFQALPQAAKRSVLFIAPTAEERGWLGAKFYAAHPLYPLRNTLADINIDVLNPWGRTRDVEIVGSGKSTLDDLLTSMAATQNRIAKPDSHPERGFFYRGDQLQFARVGIPVLWIKTGKEFIGRPQDYGEQKINDYIAHDYHQVTDTIKADWDLSGAVEDVQLLFRVGHALAEGNEYPQWKPGAEFKAIRDRTMSSELR